jgi:hypothetical protein
LDLILTNLIWT